MENRLMLDGIIAHVDPCRFSPAGIPIVRLMLEHRSAQREAGQPREARCRLPVVACGDELLATARQLAAGQTIRVQGFLARANHRRGNETLVLHAEHIDIVSA
jgi:primosomal replication protein N